MAMADPNRHTYSVFKQHFTVDKRCKLVKELGQGAYGIVCAAKYVDAPNSPGIAVKKLTNIFSKSIITKRALREIKLLRHLRGHKHITSLYDIDIINRDNFNEVYLYEELMDCDLHQIIKSRQSLTDAHFQSFVYQTLCGLKYIHSANVLHRDLKPSNLLVNADCELKICDFGLARGVHDNPDLNAGALTEYVATRWYRAPELILAFQSYSKAIDVWSVGCILAELMSGKTLFQGKDFVHQLTLILNVLGKPSPQTMKAIGSAKAQEYVANLELDPAERVTLDELFTDVNPLGLDLLKRMLVFDPADRITVDEALEHPYLKIWRDPKDEIECPTQFDFSFEKLNEQEEMRKAIVHEFDDFRAELAAQAA